MAITEILPILIPGLIFQVFLQIYAIKHVWNQDDLKEKTRIRLVVVFIIFSLIPIAIYFFYLHSKQDAHETSSDNLFFRRGVLVSVFIAFQIFILQLLLFPNIFLDETLVVWIGAVVYVVIISNEVLMTHQMTRLTYVVSGLLFFLVLFLEYLTASTPIHLMTLIIIVAILNVLPSKANKVIFLSFLPIYIGFSIFKASTIFIELSSDESISFIYTNTLIAILVFISFAALKKQTLNNTLLKNLIEQLEKQSTQIEELTIKEERSRFASEIHDNVGHTLTTAIIQLESLDTLISQKDSNLKDKIHLSKDQIRLGLNQIRTLVKGTDMVLSKNLALNIEKIITDFQNNTGLSVTLNIDGNIELQPLQQRIVLSAIKEFLTNSIKHGHATEIHILISHIKDYFEMTLTNNGVSSNPITYGYGLTQMSRNIQSIGGIMKTSAEIDFGFTLYVKIPLGGNLHE